ETALRVSTTGLTRAAGRIQLAITTGRASRIPAPPTILSRARARARSPPHRMCGYQCHLPHPLRLWPCRILWGGLRPRNDSRATYRWARGREYGDLRDAAVRLHLRAAGV